MNVKDLKNYIYENNLIPQILESIGCGHVVNHGKYWTCSNIDGDNKTAISVYNTDYINVVNYTRDITDGEKLPSDLVSLVCFNKKMSFFEGIKFICGEIGLTYYHDFEADIPESLKITKLIFDLQQSHQDEEDEKPLKPIKPIVLSYYKPYVNDMFLSDGIDYETQMEFGIGYDPDSNRITIPIYSEIGDLVGIKGRLFQKEPDDFELKYFYLEPCARNKILYGLNKTYPYIKESSKCYVFESEKATLQAWSMGYYNAVSIGGKKVTSNQIDKLTRLGVDLVFAFDKDVKKEELEAIADRFIDGVNVYCVIDNKNILEEKESPTDKKEKWISLLEDCVCKIK